MHRDSCVEAISTISTSVPRLLISIHWTLLSAVICPWCHHPRFAESVWSWWQANKDDVICRGRLDRTYFEFWKQGRGSTHPFAPALRAMRRKWALNTSCGPTWTPRRKTFTNVYLCFCTGTRVSPTRRVEFWWCHFKVPLAGVHPNGVERWKKTTGPWEKVFH